MTDTVADTPPAPAAKAAPTRWTAQWKELYEEVVTSGLCTGCAGCVIACPHDVIGYDHVQGGYKPFHLEEELGADNCIHGEKGCTSCTRACPRYALWESQADEHLFGREREVEEISGIYSDILLTRAADDGVHEAGQDGGLVSAMLLWLLEEKYIDGALVSYLEGDGSTWKAKPGVATTPEEIRASAGSRYTYSANTLALPEATERGLTDLALVGMSCQSSVPPMLWSRKAGKVGKPFKFNIGLLCSKTFDDAIFEELFEAKYGLTRAMIKKVNIKGKFQIWTHDGAYHEVPLKECHAWTREGCKQCPDFAAEHADVSTGGIGKFNDWTLTIVRTELGREVIDRLVKAGRIETRPGDDDPGAIELMHKLAAKSRKRWPTEGVTVDGPRRLPPPAPKPDAAAPDSDASGAAAPPAAGPDPAEVRAGSDPTGVPEGPTPEPKAAAGDPAAAAPAGTSSDDTPAPT
jgi:coenzyme F420 hydrogenase subunit beta